MRQKIVRLAYEANFVSAHEALASLPRDAQEGLLRLLREMETDAGLREAQPFDVVQLDQCFQRDRDAAYALARLYARRSVLAFDGTSIADLSDWFERHRSTEVDWVLAHAWLSWSLGIHHAEIAILLRSLDCAESVDRLIERDALCALHLLEIDRVDDALDVARSSSRLARIEKLPQLEYLAHWVLARARRHGGHQHLSTRILSAIRRIAPRWWQGTLDWESALSGSVLATPDGEPDKESPASMLGELVDAARAGRRKRFNRYAQDLNAFFEGSNAPGSRTLQRLLQLIDPTCPELDPWIQGEEHRSARALVGTARLSSGGEQTFMSPVWVIAEPSASIRRVLWPGLGLWDTSGAANERASAHAEQKRLDTACAVILFSGDHGLSDADCFKAIYGFEFRKSRHQGTFDVLLHRVRAELGDHVSIEHEAGRIRARVHGALAIPDPRCQTQLGDRVLQLLARQGRASAKELAEVAEMPLRSVQGELRRLVDDGVCVSERAGRKVAYHVVDTTFSAPTTARHRGS